MVLCTKLLTAWTLVVSIAASSLEKRGKSVIVGYRTVNSEFAQRYHDAGNTLVYSKSHSSDQLGPGAYISPTRGDWPLQGDTFWDCAILADSSAWDRVNKAWVPEFGTDPCTPLWYSKGESNRNAYLGDLGFTASNTVLLSKIDGFEKLQILVPPALIDKSGGMNFNVQCAKQTNQQGIAAISIYGDVDWYSWLDVGGTPQHVNP
ncbi:hypothetical protein F4818DRAFT_220325 [Hypoxylon cercidicola]|nr:hypothetical protein F4818DRAFT_220325 [Hypoxylon cercidicola]